MIKLYSSDINTVSFEQYKQTYLRLGDRDKQRLEKLSVDDDKRRFLTGRMLIFKAGEELFSNTDITINFGEHGKPYTDDFCFSISHSKDMVFCAVSDNDIGIDVEAVREIKRRDSYKLFTPSECEFVNSADDLSVAFLTVWTKKEAYVKLLGGTIKDAATDTFSLDGYELTTEYKNGYIITICRKERGHV